MSKNQDAMVIILDIGQPADFVKNAALCISRMIERKICERKIEKDKLALILMGAEDGDKNIKVAYRLLTPTWELLQTLKENANQSTCTAHWCDALQKARECLKLEAERTVLKEKKVVMFTNLPSATDVNKETIEELIKSSKSEKWSFTIVRPDGPVNMEEEAMDTDNQDFLGNRTSHSNCESALDKIVKETGGDIYNLEDALLYLPKKKKTSTGNFYLDIGPGIRIPVSAYNKIQISLKPRYQPSEIVKESKRKDGSIVKEDNIDKAFKVSNIGIVKQGSILVTNEESKLDIKENVLEECSNGLDTEEYVQEECSRKLDFVENVPEEFPKETVEEDYNVATTSSDENKAINKNSQYEKCLSVLYFTKSENVPQHLLIGEGLTYITAQKNDKVAQCQLSSFINAMKEEDMFAIVMRVKIKNGCPILGVLFPETTLDYECLAFAQIPYSEEIKRLEVFHNVVEDPTAMEVEAVNQLIASMDLKSVKYESGIEREAFKMGRTPSPHFEHFYDTIAYKALNDNKPLSSVSEDVKDLLRSPYEDSPEYKSAIEKIKKHFDLQNEGKTLPKMEQEKVKDEIKAASSSMD